ncbi:hypothetical protein FPV67DRAFT_1751803, partial [Lyophyllum atratum]
KLSGDDHIGDANFQGAHEKAPQKNPEMGLHAGDEDREHDMVEFRLELRCGEGGGQDLGVEAYSPHLRSVRSSSFEVSHYITDTGYFSYDLLRHRFWRQYLKQYDADDTGKISYLELTSMLDSLGSTLTRDTANAFFTTHGKQPHVDELSVEEVILCLETELSRLDEEK